MELTKEHFDSAIKGLATKEDLKAFVTEEHFNKHYGELNDFLSSQFAKAFTHFDDVATKAEIAALDRRVTDGFAELAIKSDFVQADILALKKDFEVLSSRTKEDDSVFVKDILKLRARIDSLERQIKSLKKQHA